MFSQVRHVTKLQVRLVAALYLPCIFSRGCKLNLIGFNLQSRLKIQGKYSAAINLTPCYWPLQLLDFSWAARPEDISQMCKYTR